MRLIFIMATLSTNSNGYSLFSWLINTIASIKSECYSGFITLETFFVPSRSLCLVNVEWMICEDIGFFLFLTADEDWVAPQNLARASGVSRKVKRLVAKSCWPFWNPLHSSSLRGCVQIESQSVGGVRCVAMSKIWEQIAQVRYRMC